MAVRSRKFFGPAFLGGVGALTLLYVVPTDRTAAFRTITVRNGNNVATRYRLAIESPEGYYYAWEDTLGAQTSHHIWGGAVLNPGNKLRGDADTAAVVVVTGFGSLLGGAPS